MRIRLTATAVLEYKVHQSDYPAGSTIEDVLRIDKEAADNDLDLILDHPDTNWDVQVIEL